MLVRILSEPKNALIAQYKALLAMDNVTLKFSDEALVGIAKSAMEKQTGARGLRSILVGFWFFCSLLTDCWACTNTDRFWLQEKILLDVMFDVPGSEIEAVIITDECVKGTTQPEYIMRAPNTSSTDESSNTPTTSSEDEENDQVRVNQ